MRDIEMQTTVLSFNISAAHMPALHAAAAQVDADVNTVVPADFSQSVGALLGILPRRKEICLAPFGEEMIVMAGFERAQMETFLDILKSKGVVIPYKAMLTPTNLSWQCDALMEALRQEHEQIKRMREKP